MNSRAVTKMCWKWRETECQTAVSGKRAAWQLKLDSHIALRHSRLSGTPLRKEAQDKATALCVHTATRLESPPAIPAVCSVAMRKDALFSLSIHGSLAITAPLRSVLGRGFVLFRSGGKTSIHCATPAVLKEKECI